jgi:2-phosphoglycerate kinase
VSQQRHAHPLPLGDDGLPYSKGLMARALITVGVAADRAYELARRVELDLAERNARTVETDRLDELARETLGTDEGKRAINRLNRLRRLQTLDLPLIVLIGGATGTGKSTVAAEVAHRLGITRLTSTDFIRQTMRAFFSREFMPAIHTSSFEAGTAVEPDVTGDPTIVGFLEQSRQVCVGVDAALRRALTEGWSLVLEGVHLVPGLVPAELDGAVVVQAVMKLADEDIHRMHFHVRDSATGGTRAMAKYLDRIDDIRRIQNVLVSRALREGVPVVENANVDRSIDEVVSLVLDAAEQAASA